MDKFNDIWKNRFNQGDMSPGDWNMPDDEVWSNIMSEVPVKNDRRKWMFLILGVLLLGLLIFSYFSFSKIESDTYTDDILNGQVGNLSVLTQYKNDESKKTEIQLNESDNSESPNLETKILPNTKKNFEPVTASDKEKDESVSKATSAPFSTNTKSKTNKPGLNSRSKNYSLLKEGNEVGRFDAARSGVTLAHSINKRDNLNSKSVETDVLKNLNNLSLLPMHVFKMDERKEVFPLAVKIKIDSEDFNSKAKFRFGFEVGAVLWEHKISDQYQSDLDPFDFDYSDNIGWYTNFNVEAPVNDYLAIYGGLQYEQIESTSGHNSALVYDVNAENTSQFNDYNLNLATPYGLSEASFRFDRDEVLGEEEVDLVVDFNSRHRIQNLSIPIGVKVFPIGQRKRWVPSLNVGMGANYLLNISNDIHSIDTHHDAIQFKRDGTASFQSPDLNQLFFDLRLGLGVGYNITRDIQANIIANWSKGVNPIFEQDYYRTSINRYHISLGLNYNLR